MVIINADSLFFGFVFDSEVLQGVLWPSYNISLNTLLSWWNFAAAPVLLQWYMLSIETVSQSSMIYN